ncbi:hypothetical protein SteCoe_6755 [Stentor coeruleus]|uniref:RING-type domain-containing protein n=1 Tax=Stentor coeruleus TaxID=5963 RepID=A0A1R2CP37_9CILI|nr:hypothetical protein SteCoe_6755 [Stentor coeruleus]
MTSNINDENNIELESPRNLIFERLQTEYGEEEEILEYELIGAELKKWAEFALALLTMLVILQIRIFCDLSLSYSVIPFIIHECKVIASAYFLYKANHSNKINIIKILLPALGNLFFYSLLIAYFETKAFNFTILILPLFLFNIIAIFMRDKAYSQCQSFSNIYFFCGNWVKIITILSIGLKLDGFTNWSWVGILWPVWITLCFLCIMSIGGLLVTIGSICAFYYKESHAGDLLSSLWFFYTSTGASISLCILLVTLLNNSTSFPYLWMIIYLFMFLIITYALNDNLVRWWRLFFSSNEQISLPSNSISGRLPLPQSQESHYRRIINAVKLPPQALVRLSSTYFQPIERLHINKITRTFSDEIRDKKVDFAHLRSLSTPGNEIARVAKRNGSDLSFLEKKCSICFENECNAVLMECGHGAICSRCAEILLNNKGKCHICRGEISQVLKIRVEADKVLSVVGVGIKVNAESF